MELGSKQYGGFRDLKVYQFSYQLALEIFEITKKFPKEELYSLTDQIRRSSRSVPSNIASLAEESETEVSLDFSKDLSYISKEKHLYFIEKYDEVARMLTSMINKPDKFCH